MKLPNRLKIIWWFLLVGFFAYLFYQRYDIVMSGATTATDIIIFLILIALITIPLFQEVSFFGVSFKKEIDTLKSEVREQIINLRSDVQNSINMRTEISPQIYLTPPTDSELRDLEKTIKPIFEETLKKYGVDRPVSVPEELDVSDNTVFLFKVRYAIENELRRIGKWLWVPPEEGRPRTALQIANNLSQSGTIIAGSVKIIREVFAICSSAIHGEDVTEASVKFVRDTSPALLAYLKSIEEQPPAWLWQAPRQWMPKWEPPSKEQT